MPETIRDSLAVRTVGAVFDNAQLFGEAVIKGAQPRFVLNPEVFEDDDFEQLLSLQLDVALAEIDAASGKVRTDWLASRGRWE